MENIPQPVVGVVAVSRDCFPAELSKRRRIAVIAECKKKKIPVIEIETVIENEKDVLKALREMDHKKIGALVVYLGNFGPESPTSLMVQNFNGPVMYVAAAEETARDLINGRGDAYCGMLNLSYNTGLRKLRPYIPEYPVGTAGEVAEQIRQFIPVARIMAGLRRLKIFSFGPRPHDFLACNAPIKPLYDLGIEIMENSELDMLEMFKAAEGDKRIKDVAKDMARELKKGNTYPDLLQKLAQFEVALVSFMEKNLGASKYGIFANKCWPAFEKAFGFVPCYVNSRFASRGIPIACEVDIYGALSEYMAACATLKPATLLDINNTVPADMYEASAMKLGNYKNSDLFMGFHCGNTPSCCLAGCALKYQLIMHRLMEPGKDPDVTRGTLEGTLRAGNISLFRLQSTADAQLKAYVAQGEVLDVDPQSFGGIGVIAIPEMARFYRHVLIAHRFPHHSAVAFEHAGKSLFAACGMLGVGDVFFNQQPGTLYKGENPF
ncbi:MAG: fucose isomerase [Verrucomicrobia bacterium]|nr:fucose isomerase [Verrucomicrobiota bacterium]